MKTRTWLQRTFILVGLLLGIVVIVIGMTVGIWLRRPFPQLEGQLQVPGLSANVDIYRDNLGIPHIYAQNRADMLFAQGYVHAQDRFWQMESSRRLAQGRMAEVLGPAALESDRFMRNIGLNRVARTVLDFYEREYPGTLADLQAYSAGVNAYLQQNGDRVSFNHAVLGALQPWPIEPWTPYDTISYGAFMSWVFGASWDGEYSNTVMYKASDPALIEKLLPTYITTRPVIVASATDSERPRPQQYVDPRVLERLQAVQLPDTTMEYLQGYGLTPPGSNAWAISGAHTASGKPMLANDPHLQVTMPSNWYQIGLHSPGFDVVGFSLPGGPGVIIGRNASISWGMTNAVVDVQEVYLEKLNPDNPLQYEFEGEWHDVEIVREVIKVAGAADYIVDVRLTRHGPIMTEVGDDISDVIAVQWEAHRKPFRLFKAILDLNAATNYTEFRQALSYWDSPAISFVYADTAGNIAYQLTGNVPIRATQATRFVVPGWTDDNEWIGWVDYADLPAVLNPAQGYVVSANNEISSAYFPALYVTVPGDRAQRISELLQEKISRGERLTAESFATMQRDYYSRLGQTYTQHITALRSDDPEIQALIEQLRGWDFQLAPESSAAGIFSIFLMQLTKQIYHDEFGDTLYERYIKQHNLAILTSLHLLADDPTHAWWDDVTTSERETRDVIMLRALGDTAAWLREHAGANRANWQWGAIHQITFRLLPLGMSGIWPLEQLVNRGPYAVGGDVTTINVHSWTFNEVGKVAFYPSLRFIADMGAGETAFGLNSIGQSGHPTHPNYDDMIAPWLAGTTISMSLRPDLADWKHLVLVAATMP